MLLAANQQYEHQRGCSGNSRYEICNFLLAFARYVPAQPNNQERSLDDRMLYFARDVGEPKRTTILAKGQFFMVNAK